jgi:hypothetical protein
MRTIACVLVATLLAACGSVPGTSAPPTTAAPPPPPPACDGTTSVPRITDLGADPRTLLRLHPAVATRKMTLTVDNNVATATGGSSRASVTSVAIPITVTTAARTAAGTPITIRYGRPLASKKLPKAIRIPLQRALTTVTGLRLQGSLADTGALGHPVLTEPPATAASLRPVVDVMTEAIQPLIVVYPPDPVGVGGRWEYTRCTRSRGVDTTVTTTVQLTARSATGFDLTTTGSVIGSGGTDTTNGQAMRLDPSSGGSNGVWREQDGDALGVGTLSSNMWEHGRTSDGIDVTVTGRFHTTLTAR